MPESRTTIEQIAKWAYVAHKQYERDFSAKCILCGFPNRLRLGQGLSELERVTCEHFLSYEFSREQGVVRFKFGR